MFDAPSLAALARGLRRGHSIPADHTPSCTLGVYLCADMAHRSLPVAVERLVHMARKRYGLAFAAKNVRFELLDGPRSESPFINLALDLYSPRDTLKRPYAAGFPRCKFPLISAKRALTQSK